MTSPVRYASAPVHPFVDVDVWLSGAVAADISTRAVSERRVTCADIRE